MNFRDVLLRLQSGHGSLARILGEFNVYDVAARLGVPRKQASNDLRRLHRMGFLKRRRIRRLCIWSKRFKLASNTCYRGYMYAYRFSEQGVNYLKWLRQSKPVEDALYAQLTYDVVSSAPEDVKRRIMNMTLVRSAFKYRGPTRNLRLFDNNAAPIADLIHQNQLLMDENKRFAMENLFLKLKLKVVTDTKEQERKMLYQYLAATLVEAAKISNEREDWRRIADYYHVGFEAAGRLIEKTSNFGIEEFTQFRKDLSIRLWIAYNHQQGIVSAEELGKYISSLGLEDVDTVLSLMDDGTLYDPGNCKLYYSYAKPNVA